MRRTKTGALVAASAALALLVAGCAEEVGPETGPESEHTPGQAEETGADGADEANGPNEADIEYAVGMIVHHQQAVEMSDILLAKDGVEPDVAALAQDIKDAQGPEIAQMEGWLDDWGHEPDADGGHHHGDHDDHDAAGHQGMMSEGDLDELISADGPQASRLFLQQMIIHHQGAVLMAEEHLQNGQYPEALALSEDVIEDQRAEIDAMDEILEGL